MDEARPRGGQDSEDSMLPFVAPMLAIFKLTRTCPKCGNKQITPREDKYREAACSRCGAKIPPPKA